METLSCDNSGNRIPADINACDPVAVSGQTLAPNKETNTEADVVGGARYAITAIEGWFIFGIATTGTAANIIWVCPQGKTIIVTIPITSASLHYQSGSDNRTAYLRRLA